MLGFMNGAVARWIRPVLVESMSPSLSLEGLSEMGFASSSILSFPTLTHLLFKKSLDLSQKVEFRAM